VLERVPVGPFSEEIALHDSGEVGIFSYSALGNVRTFVDLEAGSALAVPWGIEVAGPTDIILVP
jgi:hypothetical protein